MIITRKNSSEWMTAFHEGLLSSDQQKEVLDFLVLNPDLQAEFDALAGSYFDAPEIKQDWSFLMKPETQVEPNLEIPAQHARHQLSESEWKELNEAATQDRAELLAVTRLLPGPETLGNKSALEMDEEGWAAFLEPRLESLNQQFKLSPNASIRFEGKSALLRKEAKVVLFRPVLRWAVAACAVFALWLGINEEEQVPGKQLAEAGAARVEWTKSASPAEAESPLSEDSSPTDTHFAYAENHKPERSQAAEQVALVRSRPAKPLLNELSLGNADQFALATPSLDQASQDAVEPAVERVASIQPRFQTIPEWAVSSVANKLGRDEQAEGSLGLALLENAVEQLDRRSKSPVKLEVNKETERASRRVGFRWGNVEFAHTRAAR